MTLAALIRGKRNADGTRLATATLATVATVATKTGRMIPSVAKVATVAVAGTGTLDFFNRQQPPTDSPEVVTQKGGQAGANAPPPVEVTCAGITYATPHRCYACRSTDLWRSHNGVTVCRRCHPPAQGAEAKGAA